MWIPTSILLLGKTRHDRASSKSFAPGGSIVNTHLSLKYIQIIVLDYRCHTESNKYATWSKYSINTICSKQFDIRWSKSHGIAYIASLKNPLHKRKPEGRYFQRSKTSWRYLGRFFILGAFFCFFFLNLYNNTKIDVKVIKNWQKSIKKFRIFIKH